MSKSCWTFLLQFNKFIKEILFIYMTFLWNPRSGLSQGERGGPESGYRLGRENHEGAEGVLGRKGERGGMLGNLKDRNEPHSF